ncbi:HupE/UreJ family protein [Amphibiibacter pelophylacis]|uniref:HupE/UreJ family protein n=1 Tax=Amphibiibacter pelophylacis TaxID=1799477 RepID=A0ACC6P030_9BURK
MFDLTSLTARRSLRGAAVAAGLATAAGLAQAHTGHGTHGLEAGLVHPLGLDHLLAMVAVGVWSVFALPASKAWQGPATFMLALVVSAVLGWSGVTIPFVEHAISLSVVLFGAMLVLAARPETRQLPAGLGLGLIAAAASLHGLAHGAETPATGFVTYAIGFLVTTAALHAGGVMAGLSVRRWLGQHTGKLLTGAGLGLGVAGLALFSQI